MTTLGEANDEVKRKGALPLSEKTHWSYSEARLATGIGRTKLWQLVSAGEVPAAKIGRSVRISREGLEEYMRSRNYVDVVRK